MDILLGDLAFFKFSNFMILSSFSQGVSFWSFSIKHARFRYKNEHFDQVREFISKVAFLLFVNGFCVSKLCCFFVGPFLLFLPFTGLPSVLTLRP